MNNNLLQANASIRAETIRMETFNVVVMFDDLNAGERAVSALSSILPALIGDRNLRASYWDLGCVCTIDAVREAASSSMLRADLVILALSKPEATSHSVQAVFDAYILDAGELSILALFGATEVWTIRFQRAAALGGVQIGAWILDSDRMLGLGREPGAMEVAVNEAPAGRDGFMSGSRRIRSSLPKHRRQIERVSVPE
jgi:hypothetical protein